MSKSKNDTLHIIKVKTLEPAARIPNYAYPDDAGADLYSIIDTILLPTERKAISTGLAVEVPHGFELQIRSRSGMALKHGISVLNAPGTIDSGYRGEVKVILINLGSKPYHLKKGQKIAQLILAPIVTADFKIVDNLAESERDIRGFGSTGNT